MKIIKSEKFKRSGLNVLFTCIFLAIVIVLNVICSVLEEKHPSMNIDLTPQKLNSLSEDSLTVVNSISKPVEIYIIGEEAAIRNDEVYSSYNVKYSQVANLCDRIREANPSMVTVKYIDIDTDPGFVSDYPDDNLSSGKVLIRNEDRYRVLDVSDLFSIESDYTNYTYRYYTKADSALANAIYLVDLNTVPKVAVALGHDEMLNGDYRKDLDLLLTDNCFEIAEFNILTEEIPEDADALLILTPQSDYTPEEIDKLETYLENSDTGKSKNIFISSYPTIPRLPNLYTFLEDWGISPRAGQVIVETDPKRRLSTANTAMFVDCTSDVLSGEYSNLLTVNALPVDLLFENNSGITTSPLLTTSEGAYAIATNEQIKENPETEKINLAVMSQKDVAVGGISHRASIVYYGESETLYGYMSNSTFGNSKFILDLFKYLTDTQDVGNGITIQKTETSVRDITAPDSVIVTLGLFIFTIGLPLFILIIGLIVFIKRRNL